ncbi:BnaC05g09240D [Brassica napus]|uniref:BnaC05g09240D protein n=1 Tax=Brassica napus TaxID=3708 RepID=A0A078FYF1_BRANA|nr:BnaC05g09240D [Brassica napus]
MAMKPNGKSIVSSGYDEKVMFFKDVSPGHHEAQLRFRLIHLWEAWNPVKKTLIGLEMILIDEQGAVIQGFIFPRRIEKYLPDMKQGSVYKLNNFYGSRNKSVFWVADHTATVSFSWDSKLSVLQDCRTPFDEDSFRFHSYEEFQANSDLKGDLYEKKKDMDATSPPALPDNIIEEILLRLRDRVSHFRCTISTWTAHHSS